MSSGLPALWVGRDGWRDMVSGEPAHAAAIEVARAWLDKKGWDASCYTISIAEVQSCPPGEVSVDVTCTRMPPEEDAGDATEDGAPDDAVDTRALLRGSRVLEIQHSGQPGVSCELAARDLQVLRRILTLERIRGQTQNMEEQLAKNAAAAAAPQGDIPEPAPFDRSAWRQKFDSEMSIEEGGTDEVSPAEFDVDPAPEPELEPTPSPEPEPKPTASSARPASATRRLAEAGSVYEACAIAEPEQLRAMLAEPASAAAINKPDRRGWSALHHAAAANSPACIRILREAGALITATDKDKLTALHRAVKNPDAVRALLEDPGIEVNAIDKRGCTALILAAAAGAVESATALLHAGALGDIADRRGTTALMAAAGGGQLEVVRALLTDSAAASKVNSGDKSGTTALIMAARRDEAAICKLLLAQGALLEVLADGAKRKKTGHAIVEAARTRSKSAVGVLLEHDKGAAEAGVISAAVTALCGGAGSDEAALVALRLLLAAVGPDDLPRVLLGKTGAEKNTPLHVASKQGQARLVRELCEAGLGLDEEKRRRHLHALNSLKQDALCLAAAGNFEQVVRVLLEAQGGSFRSPSKPRHTALHAAAGAGHEAALKELLGGCSAEQQQASVHDGSLGEGEVGLTPLALAARGGHTGCVVLLLGACGAAAPAAQLADAVIEAAHFNHAEAISALLSAAHERGAKLLPLLATADAEGWNALHWSALHGGVESAEVMAAAVLSGGHGSGLAIEAAHAPSGVTALMRSAVHGHARMTAWLLAQGAKAGALDASGWNALHHAAAKGSAPNESVALLLEAGPVAIDARAPHVGTPLLLAVRGRHVDLAQQLMRDHGADVAARVLDGRDSRGALHIAAANVDDDMCGLLLRHAASGSLLLEGRDEHGETPLSLACASGLVGFAALFVEAGAALDAPTGTEDVPVLQRAVRKVAACDGSEEAAAVLSSSLDVAAMLLLRGADAAGAALDVQSSEVSADTRLALTRLFVDKLGQEHPVVVALLANSAR